MWPQYNGTCRTKELRRWLLPDAYAVKEEWAQLSPEDEQPDPADVAELDAAIAQGEEALNMTIADAEKADAATERLTNILVKLGKRSPKEEQSQIITILEPVLCALSLVALRTIGGNGYSDVVRAVIKGVISRI